MGDSWRFYWLITSMSGGRGRGQGTRGHNIGSSYVVSMSVLALCHRDVHFGDRWNIGGLNQTMDQLRCHRWKRQDET